MNFLHTHSFAQWPEQRSSWVLLALSATALVIAALYFQHGLALEPCEQCIYQRTAMIALALGAWFCAIKPQLLLFRVVGYISWVWAAFSGLTRAHYHVWVQTGMNALFSQCNLEPNFPSWLPLHEWLPNIFAITGLCSDANWQFLSLAMSEWMRIIFAFYFLLAIFIITFRLWKLRRL